MARSAKSSQTSPFFNLHIVALDLSMPVMRLDPCRIYISLRLCACDPVDFSNSRRGLAQCFEPCDEYICSGWKGNRFMEN